MCQCGGVKIVDCTTFVIGNPPPHHGGKYFIVVKLTTDTGVIGYGEIYVALAEMKPRYDKVFRQAVTAAGDVATRTILSKPASFVLSRLAFISDLPVSISTAIFSPCLSANKSIASLPLTGCSCLIS